MTELLQAEFEDETATTRRLTPRRGARLRQPDRRGRQRDHDPADRLDRQGARPSTPTSASSSSTTAASSRTRSRSCCATRRRRRCRRATSPRTSSSYGQVVPEGSVMLLLNGSGNRDDRKFADGDSFDIPARSTTTCPSATASTSASARRWPASRAASRSTRCCSASRRGRSTGTTPCRPAPRRCAAGSACPVVSRPDPTVAPSETDRTADGAEGEHMKAVVVGASSGLGRCIAHRTGSARAPGRAAGPAPRADRGGRRRGRSGVRGHRLRRHRLVVVPGRHRRGGRRRSAASTPSSTRPGIGPLGRIADVDSRLVAARPSTPT